jgi:hypothetical protein
MLYSLAAVYIALTEAIATTFGRSVEPLANHLLEQMLPAMPVDSAELCRCLVEFTDSQKKEVTQNFDEPSQELH